MGFFDERLSARQKKTPSVVCQVSLFLLFPGIKKTITATMRLPQLISFYAIAVLLKCGCRLSEIRSSSASTSRVHSYPTAFHIIINERLWELLQTKMIGGGGNNRLSLAQAAYAGTASAFGSVISCIWRIRTDL